MNMSEARWKEAILPSNTILKDVIENLNSVALKIVLIVSDDGRLVGTISDGDIRRGLLRGLNLQSLASEVVHTNPLVAPPGLTRELVVKLMLANKIQQIPIVSEKCEIVGLYSWNEVIEPINRSNTMVIMVGGMGVRLRPLTENCPKPMLEVMGKPILEHIIERAKSDGFRRFIFAVHYLGKIIEDYFQGGEKWGVVIEYLNEERPLGTAGALSLMAVLPKEPIVVSNGDVLTDIRYGEMLDFHLRYEAAATMAVRTHEWQHPFGVVQIKGVDIVGFNEKPVARTHINAGVYVLDPQSIMELTKNEYCDMPTLFEKLQIKHKRTVAYPMHEPWLDVGRPADLITAKAGLYGAN